MTEIMTSLRQGDLARRAPAFASEDTFGLRSTKRAPVIFGKCFKQSGTAGTEKLVRAVRGRRVRIEELCQEVKPSDVRGQRLTQICDEPLDRRGAMWRVVQLELTTTLDGIWQNVQCNYPPAQRGQCNGLAPDAACEANCPTDGQISGCLQK
jgi:hypothetical protein